MARTYNIEGRAVTATIVRTGPFELAPGVHYEVRDERSGELLGVIRSHDGPSRTDRGSTHWFTWFDSWVDVGRNEATNWSESLAETVWENCRIQRGVKS